MTSFFKACWQRRWFRALTWIFVTLLTITVLLHQWANWSGARRWQAAQSMLAAQGETLDFRRVAPEPCPDEQNFCAIPLLKNLALNEGPDSVAAAENRKKLEALALPTSNKEGTAGARPMLPTSASSGTPVDLRAWADWLRKEGSLPIPSDSGNAGRDVLAALAKHEAVLGELKSGLGREQAQWTPSWRSRELPGLIYAVAMPHYKSAQSVSQVLGLRSIAAANAGELAQAHESLLVMLHLSRASLEEPFLIGSLVGMTQALQACSVTWELCHVHAGTAQDFRRLEAVLRKLDMRAFMLRAFRGEMAGGASAMQWLKQTREARIFSMVEGGVTRNEGLSGLLCLVPGGWFDMNAASMVELYDRYIITPLRDQGLAACVKRQPELEGLLLEQKAHRYLHLDSFFAVLSLPATTTICSRAVFTQNMVNQAIIACALERYYAEHGSYADSLAAITLADGGPLPLDTFTGKSMSYRKTPGGRYALWSVGFDGEDDGGRRVLDERQPEKTRFHDASYAGDWVWDFPEK